MMRILLLVFSICALQLCIHRVEAQKNERKQKKNLRGRKRRQQPGSFEAEPFSSLTVTYPMHIFDITKDTKDWRNPAVKCSELATVSDKGKPYAYLARAQDQEDVWLYENWFYGMKDGVIMESGALDGKLFSTSFMFEKFANWTALHVEADPENYSNLKRNRGKAVNVHGALCSEPRLLHYSSEGVIPVRGFIEFMSPSFIKKWHGRVYNNKTSIADLPTVQCLPVKMLLKELSVKHIDLWILDTEGAEESVLKGTDFNAVRINAVAMECDEHDLAKNERKTSILESNGFQCTLIERNCMCKNKAYTASTAKSLSELRKWDGQKWSGTYTAPAAAAAAVAKAA
mmetsp:Transcript_22340/g.37375  ORF Transcript_22340/g.37375 Transcript_22340/m.37375 type:complete len:343 (-) Transcript_22340:146-1174(-)|eukprot:CAMPEP_0174971796 /NCGR_PEP_ID=MMETSP0004_2-20121128/10232_1 /TAXON_ID=420556 /ORGANISM="Ochromonas sp., Strain CCMP1393" /LENGTH=342 /DNA_ID=CAMNT_0016221867 /DNA_START=27 /DNA_END=1055 /DNA_ORIENTATION=-